MCERREIMCLDNNFIRSEPRRQSGQGRPQQPPPVAVILCCSSGLSPVRRQNLICNRTATVISLSISQRHFQTRRRLAINKPTERENQEPRSREDPRKTRFDQLFCVCFGYQQFRLINSTRKEDKGMYACGRKEPRRAVDESPEVIQQSHKRADRSNNGQSEKG